jgi:hypothetical protein
LKAATMSFKIAIGNIVQVPLKFTLRDGSVDKLFAFSLTAMRRTPEEIDADTEKTLKDFLLDNITDWCGQTLVLQDNNEPAPFSREAFDFMLKQPGMVGCVWRSYQHECGSKEKN